jgi:HSP20 family molecular chaperone IbpA
VNADAISAAFENGILLVTLPKKEVKPVAIKQITIA